VVTVSIDAHWHYRCIAAFTPKSFSDLIKNRGLNMQTKMTMIYWKSDKFWLGKLLEHPEIMTQGESIEELEENIKDAYLLMALDDVPEEYATKEISL